MTDFSIAPDLTYFRNFNSKPATGKKVQKPKQQNPVIVFYDYRAPLGNQMFADENMAWHCAAVAER